MQITVSMPSTGPAFFPNLAKPAVIDVDRLPSEVAEKLKELAQRARIFDQPDTITFGAAKHIRDPLETNIIVEQGDLRRTIRILETSQITDQAMVEFIKLVREQADLAKNRPAQENK